MAILLIVRHKPKPLALRLPTRLSTWKILHSDSQMDYNRLSTQKEVGAAVTTLLVGFDSAWTPTNSGALVGALHFDDGTFQSLGTHQIVDYRAAEDVILKWQAEQAPTATIVLLD